MQVYTESARDSLGHSFVYANSINRQQKWNQNVTLSMCSDWNYANCHKDMLLLYQTYDAFYSQFSFFHSLDRLWFYCLMFILLSCKQKDTNKKTEQKTVHPIEQWAGKQS